MKKLNWLLLPVIVTAIEVESCYQETIQLQPYDSMELTTRGYPGDLEETVSCLYKFVAPLGYRPAIQFMEWSIPNCALSKFNVYDSKGQNSYSSFCGVGTPAPLTAKGRFLDIDFSFLGRIGSAWGGGTGVRVRIHVALVRRAGWKPERNSQPEFRSTAVKATSYKRTSTQNDWSWTKEDSLRLAVVGSLVFLVILGGLLFHFNMKKEEQMATNGEGPMKGHPRPTGYRAYLEKVKITPNDQTSSTDAGESTDRSSNTESSQVNGSLTFKFPNPSRFSIIDKQIIKEKKFTRRPQRKQRRPRKESFRSPMERFQFDISQAFRRSGYDLESQISNSSDYSQEETTQTGRDPSMPSAVPENPMNSSHGAPAGRQTRYKDEHYERWSHRNKPKRSETMREKIKRAFSIKSVKETFGAVNREKSRLYGPHARPAMRQRKAENNES
ncbi:Oidioi.mRNA.OKI2018_I69.XSR.g14120.t1.cds [Oikopleura dioica]|uniref:Oidioi.mRNA.OKI2018_I69.XSR.g14120.t1.cds n=1 Tax=Oikopleura dioica TaxID=34765 RepID=A0ABN7SCS4_OIKDI|nr:Oidioi.mRNA.OKI2018_I69.XSR.g14120.t1.cds [Oikopleura dioica]